MDFWQAFLSKPYFTALITLSLLQPLILFASDCIEEKLADVATSHRLFFHLGKPLLFTFSVVLFIYLAYPASFGLAQTASLSNILEANRKTPNSLVNLVFILGFLLPIIPVLGKLPGTVVAIQAMVGNAAVFKWMTAQSTSQTVSLLPNPAPVALLLTVCWLLHVISTRISLTLGDLVDRSFNRNGFSYLFNPAINILLHSPFILAYTLSLGNQLPE